MSDLLSLHSHFDKIMNSACATLQKGMVHYLLIGSDELKGTLNNFVEKNLKIRISKISMCTIFYRYYPYV